MLNPRCSQNVKCDSHKLDKCVLSNLGADFSRIHIQSIKRIVRGKIIKCKGDRKMNIKGLVCGTVLSAGIICAAVTQADAVTTPMTKTQQGLMQIMDICREIGLEENNPIIVECKKQYHNELHGPELKYIGQYQVVGYDNCVKCCGKTDGITKSGTLAEVGRTIATSGEFEFGTKLYIDGLGTYMVEDRGPGRGIIDVYCNNHKECYALTGDYDVYEVIE